MSDNAALPQLLIPPSRAGTTKSKRHQFWLDVFQRQKLSRLTITKFCNLHGLKPADFKRWRYRIGKICHTKNQSTPTGHLEPAFAKLVVTNEGSDEPVMANNIQPIKQTPNIGMVIGSDQIKLEVPVDFHEPTLNRLLKVVRENHV